MDFLVGPVGAERTKGSRTDNASLEKAQDVMKKHAIGSMLNEHDPVAVSEWAHAICHDITVAEAAEALGVEPSRSAVINALVGSLPSNTCEVAKKICESKLLDGPSRTDKSQRSRA
jgi:hypothetical protein